MTALSRRRLVQWLVGSTAAIVAGWYGGGRTLFAQTRREFTVTATRGEFKVANSDKKEIRVTLGDLVHINFDAQDIPHSFTTEETTPHYRIARRAEPGKPVSFEFRADRAGEIPIYCS